jgi:diguanylate cyclase (GGDEF)-like protein
MKTLTPSTLSTGIPTLADLTIEVDNLNKQAVEALLSSENQVIQELCTQALQLAAPDLQNPIYPFGAASALLTMARYYKARGDHGRALDVFSQALTLFEAGHHLREIVLCRSYIGTCFAELGDYSRSAEILNQSLHEAENIPDKLLAAEITNDLSYAYVLHGMPELALSRLEECIRTFEEAGDKMRMSWALDSLAQACLLAGKKEEALVHALRGLETTKELKIYPDIALYNQSIGDIYLAMGDLENASRYYQEELRLARQYDMRSHICSSLLSTAKIYVEQKKHQEALPLLYEALGLAEQNTFMLSLRECCRLLSQIYKQIGLFQSALEFHERFFQAEKTIYNTEAEEKLRKLHVLLQLETARKETELYQMRALSLQNEIEEQKRTQQVLEQLAVTDPLTKIHNRRAFFQNGESTFRQALQQQAPLSLLMIDIDHFKQINDTYGHQAGDQILTLITERLRHKLRATDLLARYGGEEFVILLDKLDKLQTMETANRLRQAIGCAPFRVGELSIPVTISLGAVVLNHDVPLDSFDRLIALADNALYQAKKNGRNCVVLAGEQVTR